LFMGEEWGSKAPFPFFCDFQGDLAKAVRNGRRQEYAWAYAKYGDEIPDPLDKATMQSAVLDWAECDREPGRKRLALVRELLTVRQREIVPRLVGARFGQAQMASNRLLTAQWRMGDGKLLSLTANLSDRAIPDLPGVEGTLIWGGALNEMPAWSVRWHIG
jgi:maltooligosyltrehalose trehalohydrolase